MANKSSSWDVLVPAAKKNDSAAITELIEQTQKSLFTFCFHLTHHRQAAEDLTHDTYLKALRSLHQLESPSALLAWLKKIARSLYLDLLRSSEGSLASSVISLEALSHSETGLAQEICTEENKEENTAALQVLKKLSEEDQVILILIDIQGCSYQEASQVLEIPEGTVKSKLSRARQKFSSIFNGTKS